MDEEKKFKERDEEVDIAQASEIARNWIKDNVGSLILHQFRIESIEQNKEKTRYIVICSIIPDVGEERIYYLIKVDVVKGKIVSIGKGKKNPEGKLELEKIEIADKWKE